MVEDFDKFENVPIDCRVTFKTALAIVQEAASSGMSIGQVIDRAVAESGFSFEAYLSRIASTGIQSPKSGDPSLPSIIHSSHS